MANDKEKKGPEQKELLVSKDASIDYTVKVEALDKDPYHETGTIFDAGTKKAKELVARGWVKYAAVLAFILMASFGVQAQSSVLQSLYNTGTTHEVGDFATVTATRDTVTNAGSGALLSKRIAGPGAITIQVNVTKVSGTVGGTITLQGSLDGTNYKALNTEETQTALATITATDATNVYHWRLSKSPFIYYRVSWAGTGTMVAYMDAYVLKHGTN